MDAARAAGTLSESSDTSLSEAARFIVEHRRRVDQKITIDVLIDHFLEAKEIELGAPINSRYLKDLKSRVGNIFREGWGQVTLSSIFTPDGKRALERWLSGPRWSAQTRRHYYSNVGSFFEFAVNRGYCTENPIKGIGRPKVPPRSPEILDMKDIKRLLHTTLQTETELGMLPYIVLGLFAGIRVAEIGKFFWKDLRWETNDMLLITIPARIAKKRRTRNIEAVRGDSLGNLLEWLEPYRNRVGPMVLPNHNKRYIALKKATGIDHFPHNYMRHNFASMHYALHRNSGQTIAILGQKDDNVLFEHYRALTITKEAKRYFSLRPSFFRD